MIPPVLPRTPVGLSRVPREAWLVIGLLGAQQVLLLGGYWAGTFTPPWDFYGTYNAEAFAWWHDGGFFDPPVWMPYQWGGYPAAASIQNSSWYLPVGLVAETLPFTIHAAAGLSALHVALGSLGAYVLVRRWVGPGAPAVLAFLAYSFAAPFFANAQHVDIVRATGWLPWLLLLTSPHWPWRRWWSVPLGTLVLWQAIVSSYGGVLVIAVYALASGTVMWQLLLRPRLRDFLLPLVATGAAALGLSLLKYLPNLLIRGTPQPREIIDGGWSADLLATLFFGYDVDFLPFDVTMRALFVVAPVLLLAVFAPVRSPVVHVSLVVAAVPVLLGFPIWPWTDAVTVLPGLDLSRFRFMDARTVALVPVVVLGAAGLGRLLAGPVHRLRWVALAAVPALAVWLAVTTPYQADEWMVPLVVLTLGTLAVVAVVAVRVDPAARTAAVMALMVLVVVSGVDWAHDSVRVWQSERGRTESETWGASSGALIAARTDPAGAVQRPGRRPPAPDGWDVWSQVWVSAFYSGDAVIGGKSPLKGNPSFEALLAASQDPDRPWVVPFFAAPGVAVAPALATDRAGVDRCAATGECGPGLTVTPVSYFPGEHRYRVVAATDTEVWFNEAYYSGWSLTACADDCRDVPVAGTDIGAVAATVPAGTWDLTLVYRTPGQAAGWWCFAAGLVVALGYPAAARLRTRKSS